MRRLVPSILLLSAFAAALATAAPPGAPPQEGALLLTGGTLVDPRTGTAAEADLLIVDGAIVAAGRLRPEAFAGEVVDASGKWIVPGLRDLHVHAFLNQAPGRVAETLTTPVVARRMLYSGVTGFLDLFNLEDYVLLLRDHQRETGEPSGADIYAAGPCLTAPGGHCTEYRIPTRLIDSPEAARREVGELAAKAPDVVKLVYAHVPEGLEGETWRPGMPSIDRPTLEAAVAAAAERGLPTVVHVRSWADVRASVEAGATAVTHVPTEGPVPEGLAALMAERGTVMIPTLAGLDTSLATDPAALESPLLQAVTSPEVLAAYRDFAAGGERAETILRSMGNAHAVQLESVGKLAAAGVSIVAGTDSGNPWTVQGFSLHRELALLVEAGLTAQQALASATTAAGDLLGRSWGLAPGDEGSVLVLDASPLEDIRNTQRIYLVVHHGEVVDGEAILAE
jgi:imidazolonepropionase-like amidohydrolase